MKKVDSKKTVTRRQLYSLRDAAQESMAKVNGRVCSCQKVPSYGVQKGNATMGISKNESGRAFYHGVGSCGSVWECPVCSQKISATRRMEMLTAMKLHRQKKGYCALVTLTFSHKRTDDLKELLKKLSKALSQFKGTRQYKTITRENLGYIGGIRALEVTHSDANGWHPHIHEVWFLDGDMPENGSEKAKEIKNKLFDLWHKYCEKNNLGLPNEEHGFDIQFAKDNETGAVAAYAGKWGQELTSAHTKKGKKNGSRSPWEILRDINSSLNTNRVRDLCLFREYAMAFKGRAQLYWSPGLKDHFGLKDVKDDEVANAREKVVVRELSSDEWKAIKSLKHEGAVLDVAESAPMFLSSYVEKILDYYQQRKKHKYKQKIEFQKYLEKSVKEHLHKLGNPEGLI